LRLAQACPAGDSCYTRTQCGIEITCLRVSRNADTDAATEAAIDDAGNVRDD
jgi:hypothetical protein